ncbi:hypothetical protein D3C75_678380 [compost metagenome]
MIAPQQAKRIRILAQLGLRQLFLQIHVISAVGFLHKAFPGKSAELKRQRRIPPDVGIGYGFENVIRTVIQLRINTFLLIKIGLHHGSSFMKYSTVHVSIR